MIARRRPSPARRPRRVALVAGGALLALAAPGHALLDLRPFGGASYEHDDNVYRFADPAEAAAQRGSPTLADSVRRVSAGSWAQLDYGRQALRAFGELRHYEYGQFEELERTEGTFEGRLDWNYGIPWSGHLLYEHAIRLEPVTSTETGELGMQTLQEGEFFITRAMTPRWRTEGALGTRRKRHARPAAENSDLDEVRSRFGFSWASPLGTAGIAVEVTRGDFPHREAAPERGVVASYRQSDFLLRASNVFSAVSTIEAETGYTVRVAPGDAGDFHGLTGRLRYLWRWTPQTSVDAQVFRRLRDIEEQDANYVEELGLALQVQRSLTRTLGLVGRAEVAEQDYGGSPATSGDGTERSDHVDRFQLGLSYAPRRWVLLKPSVGLERRYSTRADREYDATMAGVTLEVRTD